MNFWSIVFHRLSQQTSAAFQHPSRKPSRVCGDQGLVYPLVKLTQTWKSPIFWWKLIFEPLSGTVYANLLEGSLPNETSNGFTYFSEIFPNFQKDWPNYGHFGDLWSLPRLAPRGSFTTTRFGFGSSDSVDISMWSSSLRSRTLRFRMFEALAMWWSSKKMVQH